MELVSHIAKSLTKAGREANTFLRDSRDVLGSNPGLLLSVHMGSGKFPQLEPWLTDVTLWKGLAGCILNSL